MEITKTKDYTIVEFTNLKVIKGKTLENSKPVEKVVAFYTPINNGLTYDQGYSKVLKKLNVPYSVVNEGLFWSQYEQALKRLGLI